MLKKVHLKITLLFTIVSTLILTVMSGCYLYMNHQSLYQNAMFSFQNDINTFALNFEKNTSLSYDWLQNLQSNYNYLFYLYDNDTPFRFVSDTKTDEEKHLIQEIRIYYQENYIPLEPIYTPEHQEFSYQSEDRRYHVSIISIPGEKNTTEIFVVHPLTGIQLQLHQLYFRFILIGAIAIAVFFAFAWCFTKKLMLPVREAQEKQIQFIAAASHEIRNPVNTILSAIEAMEKASPEQQKAFAVIAQKEGQRLSRLTDDLLLLARSDQHSFQTQLGKGELDTLVLDCYEAFIHPARKKNIRLSVKMPDNTLIAEHIDRDRIKQVIAILLDNAISYTPENGEIQLICGETAKACYIQITDNGIGIDDAVKERIFERFYRADHSRTDQSHFGLGLCIAKEIIDMHHGKITVYDTKGGGTTFKILLPK